MARSDGREYVAPLFSSEKFGLVLLLDAGSPGLTLVQDSIEELNFVERQVIEGGLLLCLEKPN